MTEGPPDRARFRFESRTPDQVARRRLLNLWMELVTVLGIFVGLGLVVCHIVAWLTA